MKILLFGTTGQVGQECLALFNKQGWEVISIERKDVDFRMPSSVYESVLFNKPDIVVNACAYTAVDKAESESELAGLVNAESVELMAKACSELDIPIVHISTDYVFNGLASSPYCEDDEVDPQGVYGRTKLEGEKLLTSECPKSLIIRTSWVFSAHGNNFVKTMIRLGKERDELGVVGDQFGCPTFAGDISQVIADVISLIEQAPNFDGWGTYHCSDAGVVSWNDFAQKIFRQAVELKLLSKAPKVNSITTNQYPTPATRPAYSVLNCNKLEALLGRPMPHWKLGLQHVCETLLEQTRA